MSAFFANMKPNFFDLPNAICDNLLWKMDLDYDSYDSSMSECVRNILVCEDISDRNKEIIEGYYSRVELSETQRLLAQHIESVKESLAYAKKLLEKTKT